MRFKAIFVTMNSENQTIRRLNVKKKSFLAELITYQYLIYLCLA